MTSLGIFGMGYVGSEVAELAAEHGYDLYACDADPEVVTALRSGTHGVDISPEAITATTDGSVLVRETNILVIAVPSPLDSSYTVDLSALRSVSETISETIGARSGDSPLVVVESTIPPGTTENVVVPSLTTDGAVIGEDINVAHAPERITPGNDEWPIEKLPRVVGAVTESGRERSLSFYRSLIDAEVHPVKSPSVAEASKIIENAFRDVNIAFVNEVAMSLSELGIDAIEALNAAGTKPFGFMQFEPGAGVGGHCIPVDPYLLIGEAEKSGFDHQLLKLARDINDDMPSHIVDKTVHALNHEEVLPNGADVLLLGRAFKRDVSDTRNSPSYKVQKGLDEYGCNVDVYDPYIERESTVKTPYTGADAVVVVTNHSEFKQLELSSFAEAGTVVVVDGRNVFSQAASDDPPLYYTAVGR